jgi:6-phosphogluconolactonase
MTHLHVFPDNPSFVNGSAEFITAVAATAIAEHGRFTIALSGGGTPKPIYARLAMPDYRDRIAWEKVHIFFGDERCVPPDDRRSNYRMVYEAWLGRSPSLPKTFIAFTVKTTLPLRPCATQRKLRVYAVVPRFPPST